MSIAPRSSWLCALIAACIPAHSIAAEARGVAFPLRVGVGVVPLVGYSPITNAWGEVHTLSNGGWVPVTLGPAVRVWESLSLELGVGAFIPVEDAWGFPDFRLALMPAVRWDGALVYARAGMAFMTGEGSALGFEAALGVTIIAPLYVGVTTFGVIDDLLIGNGLEIGLRFDDLRLGW